MRCPVLKGDLQFYKITRLSILPSSGEPAAELAVALLGSHDWGSLRNLLKLPDAPGLGRGVLHLHAILLVNHWALYCVAVVAVQVGLVIHKKVLHRLKLFKFLTQTYWILKILRTCTNLGNFLDGGWYNEFLHPCFLGPGSGRCCCISWETGEFACWTVRPTSGPPRLAQLRSTKMTS